MAYANRRDTLPQVTTNDLVREPVLLEKTWNECTKMT